MIRVLTRLIDCWRRFNGDHYLTSRHIERDVQF